MRKIKERIKGINEKKAKLLGALAIVASRMGVTYCAPSTGIPALDSLATLLTNVMKWAGWALLAVGVVMTIKAIINSSAGQSQPGELGKALGLAAGGAALLAIDAVMSLLGA